MDLKNTKGQISVFLAIILAAIIVLVGGLVDASRIRTGEVQVKRAVDSSIRSALADYSQPLKDEYGIFAMAETNQGALERTIEEYMEKNLGIDEIRLGEGLDLYDYQIESLEVTPIFNHTEYEVTRRQIFEYMKYRAPKRLLEGTLDKFKLVGEAGKMAEASQRNLEVDKALKKVSSYQEKLKKAIDGTIGDGKFRTYYVNKLLEADVQQERELKIEACANQVDLYKSQLEELKKVMDEQKELREKAGEQQEGEEGQASDEEDLKEEELKKREEELKESLESTYKDMGKSIQKLSDNIKEYKQVNEDAVEYLNELMEQSRIVRYGKDGKSGLDGQNGLKDYLNTSFDNQISTEMSKGFKEDLLGEIQKKEVHIPKEEEAQRMTSALGDNISCLNQYLASIEEIQREIQGITVETLEQYKDLGGSSVKGSLGSKLGSYQKVQYQYAVVGAKSQQKSDEEDTRDENIRAAKKELEERKAAHQNGNIDLEKKGIVMEELPSKKKVPSPTFSEEDAKYGENAPQKSQDPGQIDGDKLAQEEYSVEIGEDELEQDNEGSGKLAGNSFGLLSSMGSIMDKAVTQVEDIYINEYIMGTFKCAVPNVTSSSISKTKSPGGSTTKPEVDLGDLGGKSPGVSLEKSEGSSSESPLNNLMQDSNGKSEDLDLRGVDKKQRNRLLDYEVEYILHGNASQNTNKAWVETQIFLIRFAMDTISIYRDPNKQMAADAIAAAIAGWWTGGAGIPIIKNLILCGWGMADAAIDLRRIMNGEAVPFYKLPPSAKSKSGVEVTFNYHDYLKIFLFFEGSEKKIGRIQDLIEINLRKQDPNFKMSGCQTYVRVKATVSMKYFFMTQAFMPRKYRTAQGRHKFEVVMYQGY